MSDRLHRLDFLLDHLVRSLDRMDRLMADARAMGVGPAPFGGFLGVGLAARDAFHFAGLALDHDPALHLALRTAALSDPDFLAARVALPRRDTMAA